MLWIYVLLNNDKILYISKNEKTKLEKKNTGKTLNKIYIIAFILSVRQSLVQLYLHQEKLFS